MSKLIRSKSDVLSLVLKAEYVNEVIAKSAPKPPEEWEEKKLPVKAAH